MENFLVVSKEGVCGVLIVMRLYSKLSTVCVVT